MEKAGALGVRLAGRLTAELVLRSPQYMSCCKDYELDLRGSATPPPPPPPPFPCLPPGRLIEQTLQCTAGRLQYRRRS